MVAVNDVLQEMPEPRQLLDRTRRSGASTLALAALAIGVACVWFLTLDAPERRVRSSSCRGSGISCSTSFTATIVAAPPRSSHAHADWNLKTATLASRFGSVRTTLPAWIPNASRIARPSLRARISKSA